MLLAAKGVKHLVILSFLYFILESESGLQKGPRFFELVDCFLGVYLDCFEPISCVPWFSCIIYGIKIKLFRATTIVSKIILEGGLVVVDGLSGDGAVGGGSGAAVGANDAPLTVFKANHYEYDHTGYTDFASPSECSACKCQDCRAKHDVVINAINALTASVKELTSKRGLIPSKRILFTFTPLEIRAKRRRRVISRALSSIQKSKIATPLSVCCIEQCTMAKEKQHDLEKVNIYVCSN